MQETFVPPNDPPQARIYETELVARGVDRRDARDVKGPFETWESKRSDKRSRSPVDMNADIEPRASLEVVHCSIKKESRLLV